MCYVKAVLNRLSDLGIAETELSATDFTSIAELEKQEIPLAFVLDSLERLLNDLDGKQIRIASLSVLQSAINCEFARALHISEPSGVLELSRAH